MKERMIYVVSIMECALRVPLRDLPESSLSMHIHAVGKQFEILFMSPGLFGTV